MDRERPYPIGTRGGVGHPMLQNHQQLHPLRAHSGARPRASGSRGRRSGVARAADPTSASILLAYGIGIQNSTMPILDFSKAATGTNKLQDNILTPNSLTGAYTTDSAGNAGLFGYLGAFYAANPSYAGGSFAFLRFNPDADPANATTAGFGSGYTIVTADSATNKPVLTLVTAVPEPASAALAAMSGLVLMGRRRR